MSLSVITAKHNGATACEVYSAKIIDYFINF